MLKRISILMLILFITTLSASPVTNAQSDSFRSYVDKKRVYLQPSPQIVSNRIFVPMQSTFHYLGASVTWNSKTQKAIVNRNSTIVSFSMGSKTATINNKSVILQQAPQIINNTAYIPLQMIDDLFDANVQWYNDTRSIVIETSEQKTKQTKELKNLFPLLTKSLIAVGKLNHASLGVGNTRKQIEKEFGKSSFSNWYEGGYYSVYENPGKAEVTFFYERKLDLNNGIIADHPNDIVIGSVMYTSNKTLPITVLNKAFGPSIDEYYTYQYLDVDTSAVEYKIGPYIIQATLDEKDLNFVKSIFLVPKTYRLH